MKLVDAALWLSTPLDTERLCVRGAGPRDDARDATMVTGGPKLKDPGERTGRAGGPCWNDEESIQTGRSKEEIDVRGAGATGACRLKDLGV
mmetsp:Transcript_89604/g.141437  ORF Transcript_89604/g.141437 Transcript_89604/m.141437 type:complete len:91 (-) Transcript_89604:394-666(-)|eukprot:CAMPEP_0169361164 /NCGR_PEP_ID=MMETSP1017-20121227/30193_1 /TAXON_ID=342587 /ORGANISM="Karlodinium micrum, Strain CCMP2283" /LENGTH=90 /DNA_ID=CAMNT_0009458527 /DNA_START=528 /DNA_END=800 /DNA_ORIENTATION=-